MAKRIGYSVKKTARLLLVPRDMSIDQLSDICIAMNCEPELRTDGQGHIFVGVYPHPEGWPDPLASAIETGTAEPFGLGPKDESAVPQGDAQ